MIINEKLKARRIELGLTMAEVAKIVGVSEATVSRWESGNIGNMKRDRIALYAKALQVSPTYIMGMEDATAPPEDFSELYEKYPNIKPIKKVKIPMLGNIACGEPTFADEEHETYIETDGRIQADFCLTCAGDSMEPKMQSGDIVFIRKQEAVDDGQIAAVLIEDEATLKRVYYDKANNVLQLVAENPKYRPLVYSGEQLNSIRILGKAISIYRRLK